MRNCNMLTDQMLQVMMYVCMSNQATVASNTVFDVCAIMKRFAASEKKLWPLS